jgi:hypothetical protein
LVPVDVLAKRAGAASAHSGADRMDIRFYDAIRDCLLS